MSDAFDAAVLSRTIFGEARSEPWEGKLAVGWVIRNRWKSKKWFAGKTIASTCLKGKQFSAWNDGDPNREKMCDATDDELKECQAAAMAAILGTVDDPTDGATHYLVTAMETYPPWALGKEPHITIGRHSFFKDIP